MKCHVFELPVIPISNVVLVNVYYSKDYAISACWIMWWTYCRNAGWMKQLQYDRRIRRNNWDVPPSPFTPQRRRDQRVLPERCWIILTNTAQQTFAPGHQPITAQQLFLTRKARSGQTRHLDESVLSQRVAHVIVGLLAVKPLCGICSPHLVWYSNL